MTQQRRCGHFMNIPIPPLNHSAFPLTSPPCALRPSSAPFLQLQELATEVTAFSVITDYHKKGLNIRSQTLTSPRCGYRRPGGRNHAQEAHCSHRNGCDDTCHRSLCINTELRLYRSCSAAARHQNGQRKPYLHTAAIWKHARRCTTPSATAGMAFSNALLGIVHSMAHKTGAAYSGGHIVHGCASADISAQSHQI